MELRGEGQGAGDAGRAVERARWRVVATLAGTVTVAYGVLQYAFAVVFEPMRAELGWSVTALTGAYSVAALVAGLAAVPLGVCLDRKGPHIVMTVGSVGDGALVWLWAGTAALVSYYAVFALLGCCMAATFYESAFAVVDRAFGPRRARALAYLTLAGAFAGPLFVPLTAWLVASAGWRDALRVLALLVACTALPLHLVLRRLSAPGPGGPGAFPGMGGAGPPQLGESDDSGPPALSPDVGLRVGRRGVAPRATVVFSVIALASSAVSVHLVPSLLVRGFDLAAAGAVMATLGLMKLPGRALYLAASTRWETGRITRAVMTVQAAGLAVLAVVPGPAGVWLGAALFGCGDGASTPVRGALLGELGDPHSYGRRTGRLSLHLAVSRAAAPLALGALVDLGLGYGAGMLALSAALGVTASTLPRTRPAEFRAARPASFSGRARLPG